MLKIEKKSDTFKDIKPMLKIEKRDILDDIKTIIKVEKRDRYIEWYLTDA